MHVFVTGATGWVGSAVVAELLGAGHRVTGLSRSEGKAAVLAATGATALRATLDDLDVLRGAASAADAVIHTAFNHDFSRFAASAEQDRRAIEAMGDVLAGSDRLMVVTSGLAALAEGRLATEADRPDPAFPRQSEAAAQALAARGVRVATVRLAPTVHGVGETHGFIPILIAKAREAGVYRLDAARLYRLALERGATEPAYHAVADEGVPMRRIAEVIGRRLRVPVETRGRDHFGWFGVIAASTMAASSGRTRALTGWQPTCPDLIADIDQPGYYAQQGDR